MSLAKLQFRPHKHNALAFYFFLRRLPIFQILKGELVLFPSVEEKERFLTFMVAARVPDEPIGNV